MTSILKECSENLLCSDIWKSQDILSAPQSEVSILPKLPDRLENLNCDTLKSLVPLVTRILGNGRYIGWGKPDRNQSFGPQTWCSIIQSQSPQIKNAMVCISLIISETISQNYKSSSETAVV